MTKQEFKKLHHTYRYQQRYIGWGWTREQLDSWLLGYIFNQAALDFMRRVL